MSEFLDVFLDALLDSLKILPFLYVVYLVIEYIEHKGGDKLKNKLLKAGKWGPLAGALLGLVPQCGFSVAAAGFYAQGVISEGTLLAVFLSTSDEALPIFLTNPNGANALLPLILAKMVIGCGTGMLVDLAIGKRRAEAAQEKQLAHQHEHDACARDGGAGTLLLSALKRAMLIFIFMLAANFAIGIIVSRVGEEALGAFLMNGNVFQPVLTSLVGLIPNCAPSVIIAEAYLAGGLSLGSTIAGLCTGAGAGLLMLFRSNKSVKENLTILGILFASGTIAGMLLNMFI